MDPAKRKKIIKNILIIISVLFFFSIIGYGIYSVLKTLGVNQPICDPGQTNYSEYDNNCYQECNDDEEPCPYFKNGNSIPERITCVPKCKNSDKYDFDNTKCNDGTCTSDEDNCKFYCKLKNCESGTTLKYSTKDGWYCDKDGEPEWNNDLCPNKKLSDDPNPKKLNIWTSGDTTTAVSCDFTNENPIIFINNTNIKFNMTLNYVAGYTIVVGSNQFGPIYKRQYKDNKCQLTNVVGEKGVYKANEVLACAQSDSPNNTEGKPTYESIAPEKNIYNDFTPSSQTISVLNFYSLKLNNDKNALVKTLNKSYSNNTNKISLGVYNTSEYETSDPDKARGGGPFFKEFPLSKKGALGKSISGFWKFEKFGCKLGEATTPAELPDNNTFVTFKLENDTGYYFGIVTTSANKINDKAYIGKSGVLYFGDYCKLPEADCNKLGIPNDLQQTDWDYQNIS